MLPPIMHYAFIRFSLDPHFAAYQIQRYCGRHHLTLDALAARLGIGLDDVIRLGLCRARRHREDARQIAEGFRLTADVVVEVLMSEN